jgi:hypothetical protein
MSCKDAIPVVQLVISIIRLGGSQGRSDLCLGALGLALLVGKRRRGGDRRGEWVPIAKKQQLDIKGFDRI